MPLTYQERPRRTIKESGEERRLYFYEQGEEIPLAAQGVWQIYRGLVQFSTFYPNGEEILLGWAQPANFFGAWLTSLQTYQTKALSDVYLRWYSLIEIETSPRLAQTMLRQMGGRIRHAETLLAIAGQRKVEDRLNQLLLFLQKEMSEPKEEGDRLILRLTHQNIANAIGTTRVTVTRLLGDFQRQGKIKLGRDRHIIIKS